MCLCEVGQCKYISFEGINMRGCFSGMKRQRKKILIMVVFSVIGFASTLFFLGDSTDRVRTLPRQYVSAERPSPIPRAIGCQECKPTANCQECKLLLDGFNAVSNTLYPNIKIDDVALGFCKKILPLFGFNGTKNCPYLLGQYLPDIRSVIQNGFLSDVCEALKICPTNGFTKAALEHGVQTSPSGSAKKSDMQEKEYIQTDLKLISRTKSEPLTFVQISDIHLDKAYKKGAPTRCGYTVCCRSTLAGNGSAGTFGNYHCDAAEVTVRTLLNHIQNLNPPPAFFVYVGDNSPHTLMETLKNKLEDNLLVNTLLVDKLRHIGPIFPAIGNHETFPTSFYYRRSGNTQAILKSLSEQWPSMFHVTPDQLSNIRKHAFYTAKIMPGLRILTTNSLNEYLFNFYAILSKLDPVRAEQKRFVRRTLENARANNEKVIYVTHLKPHYSQTYPSYTDDHNQMVTEFRDVIILQLFGHEHWDVFLLNRDPANMNKVTGVSLAAPSITTYVDGSIGINPSFRVFTLDPVTFQPLDYYQYYIDVPEANEKGMAQVKKHYTFTKEYNVPDMSTSSFAAISDRIHTNWTDFQKFEANYYVRAGNNALCPKNDFKCRRLLTCQTRESNPLRFAACLLGS